MNDQRALPPGLTVARTTPTFDADSVPKALLAAHLTSAWAELIVETGSVRFVQADPDFEARVDAGSSLVILPGVAHHVEPSSDARFCVRFYRSAS